MTFSTRISLTLAFALCTAACGNESSGAAVDMGTAPTDGGAVDSGALDLSVAADGGDTDSAIASDAATLTDGGAEEQITATSCEGLTPITTIHSSLAGGFVPQNIAVSVGDIVKWVNDDTETMHTVWSTGFAPSLEPRATICLQFTHAAHYDYACYFHPSMTGSVEVTE
ncbi:MAG: hypothetical protein IPK60_22530 [Sandaracinaceae bacterium]|nr:hypothetical protein [Sandaracinaceae bacterium]